MGLDSLQGRRDTAKLKWLPEHRVVQEWNVEVGIGVSLSTICFFTGP